MAGLNRAYCRMRRVSQQREFHRVALSIQQQHNRQDALAEELRKCEEEEARRSQQLDEEVTKVDELKQTRAKLLEQRSCVRAQREKMERCSASLDSASDEVAQQQAVLDAMSREGVVGKALVALDVGDRELRQETQKKAEARVAVWAPKEAQLREAVAAAERMQSAAETQMEIELGALEMAKVRRRRCEERQMQAAEMLVSYSERMGALEKAAQEAEVERVRQLRYDERESWASG